MVKRPGGLLHLSAFVNLFGPRAIPASPPVPFPWAPDQKARLQRFNQAYREQHAGPQGGDFPLVQTRAAWLSSFEAYERIVMIAHAVERSETTEPKPAADATDAEPAKES